MDIIIVHIWRCDIWCVSCIATATRKTIFASSNERKICAICVFFVLRDRENERARDKEVKILHFCDVCRCNEEAIELLDCRIKCKQISTILPGHSILKCSKCYSVLQDALELYMTACWSNGVCVCVHSFFSFIYFFIIIICWTLVFYRWLNSRLRANVEGRGGDRLSNTWVYVWLWSLGNALVFLWGHMRKQSKPHHTRTHTFYIYYTWYDN